MKAVKFTSLILLVIILAGAGLTGCREKASQDYYPLGVSSYWEYNVITFNKDGITKASKEIDKVVGKERIDTLECYIVDRYTIEGKMPSVAQYREYLAKTDEGILCTRRAFPLLMQLKNVFPSLQTDIRHSEKELRFKNKLVDGDSWKWEGIVNLELIGEEPKEGSKTPPKPPTVKEVRGSVEYKYLGKETIHILNQDMECIKISFFGKSDAGQEIESIMWYAPGIGKVREEQKFYQGSESVSYLFELCGYNITNREPFKND